MVLDPEITLDTPEWLFLSTGIRAVDHAVEGFCARTANPYTDAQAARGLGLLLSGLAAVRANPDDVEARLECQMGAWMAMCPLASGVPMGASHGIGYVLGAAHGVPHGYTSCVMLPAVLRWNAELNRARQDELAGRVGREGSPRGRDRRAGPVARAAQHPQRPEDPRVRLCRHRPSVIVPHNPRPLENAGQFQEILALAV